MSKPKAPSSAELVARARKLTAEREEIEEQVGALSEQLEESLFAGGAESDGLRRKIAQAGERAADIDAALTAAGRAIAKAQAREAQARRVETVAAYNAAVRQLQADLDRLIACVDAIPAPAAAATDAYERASALWLDLYGEHPDAAPVRPPGDPRRSFRDLVQNTTAAVYGHAGSVSFARNARERLSGLTAGRLLPEPDDADA